MRLLVAGEFTGTVRDAFRALGHDAWSCDLLPTEKPGPHLQGDWRRWLNDGWDALIGHPVCRVLANSGVRWLHVAPAGKTVEDRWRDMEQAVADYLTLRDAPIRLKAIENPVMHKYARALLGSPRRQIVQPWWFGDPFFKATGFELHGLPDLAPTNKLTPPAKGTPEHTAWSAIHRASPGPDRWKERSRTFPGIARAMALQWGGDVRQAVAA